jgi:hypothetical protein
MIKQPSSYKNFMVPPESFNRINELVGLRVLEQKSHYIISHCPVDSKEISSFTDFQPFKIEGIN